MWVKKCVSDTTVLPRGKTAEGLNYCIDKEKYLRVFLTNGYVPMDNSASERAIRPFTIGRKNWVIIDSIRGAQASAVIYSIVETAKLNKLNVFCYLENLLTELPKLADEKEISAHQSLKHCYHGQISFPKSVTNRAADERQRHFFRPGRMV